LPAEKRSDSSYDKEKHRQNKEIQMESDGENSDNKSQDRKKIKYAVHGNINSTGLGLEGNHGVVLAHSHVFRQGPQHTGSRNPVGSTQVIRQ